VSNEAYELALLRKKAAESDAKYRELEQRYNALYKERHEVWKELRTKLEGDVEWIKTLIEDAVKARMMPDKTARALLSQIHNSIQGNSDITDEALRRLSFSHVQRAISGILHEAIELARVSAPDFEPVLRGLKENAMARTAEGYWS
jgi:hypothetical protein